MKVYIASKSSNSNFALDPDNIIAACATGVNPEGDAREYARDHVRTEEENAWVYEVEVTPLMGYKMEKMVVAYLPPKQG